MTFKITNIRVEENRMVAFYEFSNGEVNSNAFPLTATIVDIKAWGDSRLEFFAEQATKIAELNAILAEQPAEVEAE